MSNVNIYCSDVIKFFEKYQGPKFSFAYYDPPYEMNIIDNKWDGTGIVYSKEFNDLLYENMKPGAFVLCYGHARTFHRMMVALEDAGFIVHKTIFAWCYATGAPQGAVNLQRAIDNYFSSKYGGLCQCTNPQVHMSSVDSGHIRPDMEKLTVPLYMCDYCNKPVRNILTKVKWHEGTGKKGIGGGGYGNGNEQIIAASMTAEAELLKSYTYGLSAFKPMVEPIVLVQKPFENNKAVESIIKHAAGIVNVHETRYIDRWPGNFVAIHELGCEMVDGKWVCVNGCEIGEQSKTEPDFTSRYPTFAYNEIDHSFNQIDTMIVEPKAKPKERGDNVHPTIKPVKLNQYFGKLFLPPPEFGIANAVVPFSGSGSEVLGLVAAGWQDVTGIELDEKFAKYSAERIGKHTKNRAVTYYDTI